MIKFEKIAGIVEAMEARFLICLHGFLQCLSALWKHGGIYLLLHVYTRPLFIDAHTHIRVRNLPPCLHNLKGAA